MVALTAIHDWVDAPGSVVSWGPSPACVNKLAQAPVTDVPASYQQEQHIRTYRAHSANGLEMARLLIPSWNIPGRWMHEDALELKDLFIKYPNVKLAISGHIHLLDRVEYNGISYCCNGAVSGAWWAGNYQETQPGYAIIDLYPDGTFTNTYTTYNA